MKYLPITYNIIMPNRYIISDSGDIINIKTNKHLRPNNYKNEKGYLRVNLKTINSSSKKFSLHRLVIGTFMWFDSREVNHIDGNKLNCNLYNLEYVTGDENKLHAKINDLYQFGEDRYNSIFTNNDVEEICKLFEQGLSVKKVLRILKYPDNINYTTAICRIFYRKTWCRISSKYCWDTDKNRLKTYDIDHIREIIVLIKHTNLTNKKIAKKFPQYNTSKLVNVIKKISEGKLYKKLVAEVESSTTIRNGEGFIIFTKVC